MGGCLSLSTFLAKIDTPINVTSAGAQLQLVVVMSVFG